MRIFIVDTYYPAVLDNFYRSVSIDKLSYAQRLQKLFELRFGHADFYSQNLKQLGQVAQEFIVNDEKLQRLWFSENSFWLRGLPIFVRHWHDEILLAQIKNFRPDVVYCQNLWEISPNLGKKIHFYARLIVGQIASALPPLDYLKVYDLILTSFPHYVSRISKQGIASEYFRLGFEKTILNVLNYRTHKKYNTVFVGGIGPWHKDGTRLLERISQDHTIDVWGYGEESLPPASTLRKNFHGPAWGLAMYKVYKESKIALNRHIDLAENFANNLRLFEVTGVGTMLITDAKENLEELFSIGKEVETYTTASELADKISFYSKHDKSREAIAKAGQKRTLTEHTIAGRMHELVEILERYLLPRQFANGYQILENISPNKLDRWYHSSWQNPIIPLQQQSLVRRQLRHPNKVTPFISAIELLKQLPKKNYSFLEVGCSGGYYNEVFQKAGFKFHYQGCDYSPTTIRLARKTYPQIKFSIGDATNLPFTDQQFALVFSAGCILHIVNYKRAITEAARVSKKYVLFHRNPVVSKNKTTFTRKVAYATEMLEIIFQEKDLLDAFKHAGLKLLATSSQGKLEFSLNGENVEMRSYLCQKV